MSHHQSHTAAGRQSVCRVPWGRSWSCTSGFASASPLALRNSPTGATRGGRIGRLSFQFVDELETPLLIRPDGYLAAHGVSTDPHAVLANLASYVHGGRRRR